MPGTTTPASPRAALEWLAEAARYFENRDTHGEDAAHWSNVYNAENAQRIGKLVGIMDCERYDLKERLGNAERRLRQLGYERCSSIACNCKGYHFNGRD